MRHHLFQGAGYYPMAGLGDYKASFDTLEEALEAAQHRGWSDWYSIITQNEEGNLIEVASAFYKGDYID